MQTTRKSFEGYTSCSIVISTFQIEMGGPTGVPQKANATTKDVLLDFLAGGTGLFSLDVQIKKR